MEQNDPTKGEGKDMTLFSEVNELGLEKYLGTKEIESAPMTLGEYRKLVTQFDSGYGMPSGSGSSSVAEETRGYLVRYEGGYVSWSPADVYEKSYRKVNNLTFGLALEAMLLGKKVARPNWNEGTVIQIQVSDENSKMTHSYFYVTSKRGLVPWIPTFVEMLADDWEIV